MATRKLLPDSFAKQVSRVLLPRYSDRLSRANLYALIRSWRHAHSDTPTFSTREDLWKCVAHELGPDGPIDYLEFGVFEGESIRAWASLNSHPESRFFGFDSFEGLPEAWGPAFPTGAFSTAGRIPTVGDPRVRFVKGWFTDTLPPFIETFTPGRRVVVHIDCDGYSSTLFCLTRLDALLRSCDGMLVFDEFYSTSEFSAFRDYTRSYDRSFHPIAATHGVGRSDDKSVFCQVAFRLPAGTGSGSHS